MYRPKTTLEQWRILQAVVDYGGYAHAAEHLNKSQSSLNHAVAKLQSQLGVSLLQIKGRKAYLTEAGEVLLRRSRHLTQNVEDLESLAANILQDWEPEIILAVDLAFPKSQLYPVLQAFMPESRGSRLKIIDTVLTGSSEAVVERWADLVLSLNVPKGFLGEPVTTVNFVAVCHPVHQLANLPSPIDPNELAQHLQIVIKDTSSNPQENAGWLKSELRWTVSSFNTAIELLLREMGFCWLPEHEVSRYTASGELALLNIAGSSFRQHTAYLIKPNADMMGPGSRLLADFILSHRALTRDDVKQEQQ